MKALLRISASAVMGLGLLFAVPPALAPIQSAQAQTVTLTVAQQTAVDNIATAATALAAGTGTQADLNNAIATAFAANPDAADLATIVGLAAKQAAAGKDADTQTNVAKSIATAATTADPAAALQIANRVSVAVPTASTQIGLAVSDAVPGAGAALRQQIATAADNGSKGITTASTSGATGNDGSGDTKGSKIDKGEKCVASCS
jgi:hypothetical protein